MSWRNRTALVLGACALAAAGCQGGKTLTAEIPGIGSAVGGVTGAIVGHQYGQAGMGQSVGSQVGSATGRVAGSAIRPRKAPGTQPSDGASLGGKFCPVGGERYLESFKYCPFHGVELKEIDS